MNQYRIGLLGWMLAAFCLVLCALGGAASAADLPPLIPRHIVFADPERSTPVLSPDGTMVAYVGAGQGGRRFLFVRTLANGADKALFAAEGRNIRPCDWSANGRILYYRDEDERDELYGMVDVTTSDRCILTRLREVIGQPKPHPTKPGALLKVRRSGDGDAVLSIQERTTSVNAGSRDPALHACESYPGDAIAWDINLPRKQRVAVVPRDDGSRAVVVPRRKRSVHMVSMTQGENRTTSEWSVEEYDQWVAIYTWGPEDHGSFIGLSRDGKSVYLLSDKGANYLRLVRVSISSGRATTLVSDRNNDVCSALLDVDGKVLAYATCAERYTWHTKDKRTAEDFAILARAHPGQMLITDTDAQKQRWLVTYRTDTASSVSYIYDRAAKTATPLFVHSPAIDQLPLASMQPITLTARDGLVLHGYLTLPVGVPAKALPMVLLVHGGPWERDVWGYDAETQWLANRGYAVLRVNFRGSAGYGRRMLAAGNREWGGKMQDDLSDAVRWAVTQGIADAKRVAIMGSSYGGYAALAGLALTPELYAAGVSLDGPVNLVNMLTVGFRATTLGTPLSQAVGDVATEDAFLRARSPLFATERITVPVVIGQGEQDRHVPKADTDQFVAALRNKGVAVDYLVFPNEGHSLMHPENRLKFYARVEAVLQRTIGGRMEP